jgi:hypothetical protein
MKQMSNVVVRLKSDLNKIIKIPREEYYNHKELYVLPGHIKYYLKTDLWRSNIPAPKYEY